MGIISICDKYKELKQVIESAKTEIDKKATEWGVAGTSINDIINKLPF